MGVQGLWELLAPVGRRVSVETLAGKKLAIDASIWMVQFMKAMRDEKGDMVRNAHVLGFFRRICKLLFLRTKPVFVFDGGTPALKRRTVLARRRQRENAQSKIRKTAEKLLLNHLKSMRLKELAQEIENQRKMNDKKGKKVVTENAEMKDSDCKSDDDDNTKGKSVVPEDVEASDVVSKSDNLDRKGKKVLVDDDDEVKNTSWKSDDEIDKVYDQEALDAMLAASLAAEEDGNYTGNLSTSVGGGCASADDDGDEDEEMILPVMNGKVDPAVLAVLPPSMQLDLLVQMRERLMAENRQKYQKVKKAPEKFSQLQIQSYLKTVAFRREIDEVQKSASGRGVAGVQTSRIASEANREYIFSSSFTGDKQTLMAGGVEKNGFTENRTTVKTHIPSDSVHRFSSIAPSPSATGSGVDEPITGDDDVETYLDERGRVRVSRVRAMGMRMTRDLQRNLDLMKEMEHEKMKENSTTHAEAIFNKIVLGVDTHMQASDEGIDEVSSLVEGINVPIEDKTLQVPGNITGMEISFFEDERGNESNDDDDLFAHLVAGSSVTLSPVKIDPSGNHSPHAASDCSWEEGIVEEKSSRFTNDVEEESLPTLLKENTNGENEVEWEEGDCDVIGSRSPYPSIHTEAIAKSSLEEEADIQEAIRRSLENFTNEECSTSIEKEKLKNSEMAKQNLVVHVSSNGDTVDSLNFPVENSLLQSQTPREVVGFNKPGYTGEENSISVNKSSGRQLASVVLETKISAKSSEVQKPSERSPDPCVGILSDTTSEFSITGIERPSRDPLSRVEQKEVQLVTNARLDKETIEDISANSCEERVHVCEDRVHVSPVQMDEVVQPNLSNAQVNNSQKFPTSQTKPNLADSHSYKTIETTSSVEESSWKEIPTSVDIERDLVAKENSGLYGEEIRHIIDNSTTQTNVEVPMELSGAHIDEELLHLRQERADLGDEQRKLERNAESVSSEMFAECQELLQMFGVPYIIAPMEAEAQCAYMELANLVDGVVTDDSDVFLFGARNVYKNIFDDRKYVETYFMKDIESDLGLTREQLIRMALLLGSDYTEGVSGIGIVNAIEVVNAFPEEDGLQKFREWIESPDPSILGKIGSQSGSGSRRKGSKGFNNHIDCSKQSVDEGSGISENVSEGHDDDQSIVNIQNVKQTFMEKHRNVSKNWHIPSSFPSETVVSAYVSPQVDQSTDPFSWGKPDLLVLRKLCWEKFGWSNQKADELLVPVLKEYSKHETQLRLEAFYTFNERFAKIRSRRIKKAVKGIAGKRSLDLMDGVPQERANSRKARRVSFSEPQGNNENPSNPQKDSIAESNAPELSTVKQSRRKKKDRVPVPSEVHAETPIETRNVQDSNRGSSGNAKGRGRGRGRGRVSGRGRGKELSGCKLIDTSSDQDSDHNDNLETQVGNSEKTCTVRRSTRSRKRLDYTEDDLGVDGLRKSLDQNDRTCMGDMLEQEPLNVLSDADDDLNKKESAPSLEEQDEKDYLEVGGGFCFDEGEDNHSDHLAQCPDSENVNHSFDTEFSAEYLKMGGGFCVEEEGAESVEEEGDELSNEAGMNAPAINQSLPSPNKDSNGQTTTASVSPVLDEPQKVDSTPTGLSAMPFLRRKRRKT